MNVDTLRFQRRVSRRDRARRTHLHGSDVIATCVRCGEAIFRDSKNIEGVTGRRVDGTPKKRHLLCPNRSN